MFTQPLLPSGRRVRFIHEFHGVYFLSLEDVSRIYSPDLAVQAEGGRINLKFQKYLDTMERVQIERQWYLREVAGEEAVLTVGKPLAQAHGEFIELSAGPREIDEILYLPVIEVTTKVFGARTVPLVLWRYYSAVVRGRMYGEIHRSFCYPHRLSAGYPQQSSVLFSRRRRQ